MDHALLENNHFIDCVLDCFGMFWPCAGKTVAKTVPERSSDPKGNVKREEGQVDMSGPLFIYIYIQYSLSDLISI